MCVGIFVPGECGVYTFRLICVQDQRITIDLLEIRVVKNMRIYTRGREIKFREIEGRRLGRVISTVIIDCHYYRRRGVFTSIDARNVPRVPLPYDTWPLREVFTHVYVCGRKRKRDRTARAALMSVRRLSENLAYLSVPRLSDHSAIIFKYLSLFKYRFDRI